MYRAAAASVRERLTERWDETYAHFTAENPKMIYYLSMEFLQARSVARAGGAARVRRGVHAADAQRPFGRANSF